ncbi:MAG: MFS transporter [Bacteroidales bacterium]|jgi:fucose permease|nr:MFS transporter [Bacteroidales bacterium]
MEKSRSNAAVLAAGFSGMAFFGMAFVILGTVLPSLTEKFSLSTANASTVASLLPFGIMFGSLIFGPIIDRYGYKLLIIASTLLTVLGMEMLAFAESVSMIRFAIFVIGFGGGVLNGLSNALVSDASTDKTRPSNLSVLGIFYTVGAITIPLIYAWLSKSYSYVPIVSGAGVIMTLSALAYLFIKFPSGKFKEGAPSVKILQLIKEPALLLLSFILFFQSGVEGISSSWTPNYLEQVKEFTKENALYALSFVVFGLGTGRVLLSLLLRFVPRQIILYVSMIMAAAGALILGSAETSGMAITGTFLIGMGLASTFPVVIGELGERYKAVSGTALSIALSIALLGNTLINLLVGALKLKALPGMIAFCAIAVILIYFFNSQYSKTKN